MKPNLTGTSPRTLKEARAMIQLLQQELVAANNGCVALALELEERLEQLQTTNRQLAQEVNQRCRVEAALQTSELRFRALVENSADGILLINRQGLCTYASPSVQRIMGYRPEDLEGNSPFIKVHPREQERLWLDFQYCLAKPGAEIPLFCRVRSAQRGWRSIEGVCCNRLEDPTVGSVIINFRDVTERQQVEAQIRHMNRNLERKIRVRTAQLQLAFEFEATLKRITDKVRDSLDEAQIMQAVVQELSQAIPGNSCNAAIYDLTQQKAKIQYEYTHLTCTYQGRTLDIAAYPDLYTQLLAGETLQFCSLTPNPERGRVAVLAHPIRDNEGVLGDLWLVNQSHYSFNEQDVRLVQQVANQCAIALRQSRLYQAAQAQVQELERLNRLKDDFLSTVSHELRAPMANIKMSSQMLALRLPDLGVDETSPASRYVQILQDECNREIGLINDLLDLARLDTDDDQEAFQPIDVRQQLQHIIAPFEERIQTQQQQLILQIAPDLPDLVSHPAYFNRILTELLHNACKYTPPQEQIRVIASMEAASPALSEAAVSPSASPQLVLQIINTGVEIAAEECDRIFDKFYRIPNNDPWKHGGTGLGLALVKKLAERLHCRIRLTSERNETAFTLTFPDH
jgi:PAS domain S-box-containing protein